MKKMLKTQKRSGDMFDNLVYDSPWSLLYIYNAKELTLIDCSL